MNSILSVSVGLTALVSGSFIERQMEQKRLANVCRGVALLFFIAGAYSLPNASCPLESIQKAATGEGAIAPVLSALKDRITCDSYLPWKESFLGRVTGYTNYIDGITQSDMGSKFVNWGIDPLKRPFVAMQVTCSNGDRGVVTIFQAYTLIKSVLGGHGAPLSSCSWLLNDRVHRITGLGQVVADLLTQGFVNLSGNVTKLLV